MEKVTLIQIIPLPENKMLVDKEGEECECDFIAYFHSTYDERFHEIPMAFGEMNVLNMDSRDSDIWAGYFEQIEKEYKIVDR